MYENLYDVEEMKGPALNVAEQAGIEEFVFTDEFSVIPAYKEILPDGLISDEV